LMQGPAIDVAWAFFKENWPALLKLLISLLLVLDTKHAVS
jgi:hypothetical protein